MKLIDKAAVAAEIEKRIKINKECMLGLRNFEYYQGKVDALNDTISFLDTLEVKEVDVENLQEEPVSEDLEEAAKDYSNNLDNICGSIGEQTKNAFKNGAKWQKAKDQEIIETAIHHAYHNGRLEMKEQMMAKGVDGVVTLDYYGEDDKEYGCVAHDSFCLEDFGLKDMDKVKIILIKED